MILWSCPIPITPELKKEKGHNYKGRNIGPFIRRCNKCNTSNIEYLTYDRMLAAERYDENCSECNKGTKGTEGKFFKECSNDNCNNIIYFKRAGDYRNGIKNNTICQKCKNKILKERYKGGFHINKSENEREKIFNKVTKGRQEYYEKNPKELEKVIKLRSEKRKEVGYEMFKTEKAKKENSKRVQKIYESRPELKEKLSNIAKSWIEKNPDKQLIRQQKSKLSYKNTFYIKGIRCQGSSEKAYIETLLESNLSLPKRAMSIKTSLGYYFPDFEFKDKIIEIKSSYTYKGLLTKNKKQLDKIKETSFTIKPVQIIVIDRKNKILETINI